MRRRKERARYLTYDDMLTRLQAALADPRHGDLAAQRLRDRFPVVLVDEFQDTDPIQWDILRRAFHQHSTLVVIGDPKQAIYAFRGADVNSYLQVARESDHDRHPRHLLPQRPGAARRPRPDHGRRQSGRSRHRGPPGGQRPSRRGGSTGAGAPVRVRVLPPKENGEQEYVNRLRRRITKDLVAEIAALLGPADARLRRPLALDGDEPRPVQASDLAVLVRRNVAGEQIRDALAAAGIPAVLHGSDSVFSSLAAQDWLRVLQALEQPRQALVREAALTSLVGWTFPRLALADETALADLVVRLPPLESDARLPWRRRPAGDHGHRHRAERTGAGPTRRRAPAHRPPARRPTPARPDDRTAAGRGRACASGWPRRSRSPSPTT